MGLAIDHIVLAGSDLDSASEWFSDLTGLSTEPGGIHDGWGTRNRLVSLGPDTYLEIIAPDPNQPDPAGPRPLGVDDVDGGSPRITTFACRAPGIAGVVERAREAGYDPGDAFAMSRSLADGSELAWQLTVPGMIQGDGLIPFLIDWGESVPPSRSLPSGGRFVSLTGEHPDPGSIESALTALGVDLPVSKGPAASLTLTIICPRGTVEFS